MKLSSSAAGTGSADRDGEVRKLLLLLVGVYNTHRPFDYNLYAGHLFHFYIIHKNTVNLNRMY